ncbi:PepSY domain-containing protein [Ruania zhangjianzhongii]|uniref:PepSY domain-containing protein n=1 Tax=Ruania zhangjianzhongii TaxID=2603206 RepID=UPI0011C73DDF|nr:PepSY domain-containing protein [Ruania zhangjianzhongii]
MRSTRSAGLALVGALALAGCGGSGDGEETTSPGDPIVVGDEESSTASEDPSADQSTGSGSEPSETATDSSQGSGDAARTPADANLREVSVGVAVAEALQISADEVGADTVVYSIDLDYSEHYSAWVWTIDTITGGTDHEVEIDADTGDVLDHEQESSDDQVEAVDPADPMTPEQAIDLAVAEVDGPVRSWQLEFDDGERTYQVEITADGDEVEVTVDVASGAVSVDD